MDEVQRIKSFYRERKGKDDYIYSCHFSQERENEIKDALRKGGFISLASKNILDVGCGTGEILSYFLKEGVPKKNLYGIDLLPERIGKGKITYPDISFICGNAESLPFEDDFFDIITQSTVFTSILDYKMKQRIAAEMLRVLRMNGLIIWHDYRYNNPFNPHVKGIRKKEIMDLFPNCRFAFELINLNPIIAKLVGKFSWNMCELLRRIRFLWSH